MSSPFERKLTSPALIGVAIVIVVIAVLFTDVISTGAIGFGREGKSVGECNVAPLSQQCQDGNKRYMQASILWETQTWDLSGKSWECYDPSPLGWNCEVSIRDYCPDDNFVDAFGNRPYDCTVRVQLITPEFLFMKGAQDSQEADLQDCAEITRDRSRPYEGRIGNVWSDSGPCFYFEELIVVNKKSEFFYVFPTGDDCIDVGGSQCFDLREYLKSWERDLQRNPEMFEPIDFPITFVVTLTDYVEESKYNRVVEYTPQEIIVQLTDDPAQVCHGQLVKGQCVENCPAGQARNDYGNCELIPKAPLTPANVEFKVTKFWTQDEHKVGDSIMVDWEIKNTGTKSLAGYAVCYNKESIDEMNEAIKETPEYKLGKKVFGGDSGTDADYYDENNEEYIK